MAEIELPDIESTPRWAWISSSAVADVTPDESVLVQLARMEAP